MITSCGGLGDVIMFTPALKRLKEKFPSCHITFLCRDNHRQVLEGLPYVDKVACIYRGKLFGRYRAVPALKGLDAIVFTDLQPVIMFFAKLLRIRIRAGYRFDWYKYPNSLTKELHDHVTISRDYVAKIQANAISEALETNLEGDMTNIEISAPTGVEVQSIDRKLEKISLAPDSPYILLSPFTGATGRNLTPEQAIQFVKFAEEKYKMPVVISAPPDKQDAAKNFSRYALTESTTILELVELVRRTKLLVTPDSGPMHIAGALGTKCVAIFSKDLPSRWAPKKNCLPICLNVSCSPCNSDTFNACTHFKCMRNISVDMIIEACDKILGSN